MTKKQLSDLVMRGKTDAAALSFIRDDPKHVSLDVHTQPLERYAMTLPVSVEMTNDEPAMRFYVNTRGTELFERSLSDAVVNAIQDAGAPWFRPRLWETNKRAVRRAIREVERVGLYEAEAVPVDRSITVVGAFSEGAVLWTRGKIKIDTSTHDYFIRNLVAVRFEQFAAVTVFRPSSFGLVKTRDWRRMRRVFR